MKASELRIGNLFIEEYSDKIIKVIKLEKIIITFSGLFLDKWQAKPIPLNEEWLVKFGFETDNIEWWNGIISIGIYKDGLFYCPTGEISLRIGKEIQYLHQLQNLYFTLIGEELIINNK